MGVSHRPTRYRRHDIQFGNYRLPLGSTPAGSPKALRNRSSICRHKPITPFSYLQAQETNSLSGPSAARIHSVYRDKYIYVIFEETANTSQPKVRDGPTHHSLAFKYAGTAHSCRSAQDLANTSNIQPPSNERDVLHTLEKIRMHSSCLAGFHRMLCIFVFVLLTLIQ